MLTRSCRQWDEYIRAIGYHPLKAEDANELQRQVGDLVIYDPGDDAHCSGIVKVCYLNQASQAVYAIYNKDWQSVTMGHTDEDIVQPDYSVG
jgi:hypothetical protein